MVVAAVHMPCATDARRSHSHLPFSYNRPSSRHVPSRYPFCRTAQLLLAHTSHHACLSARSRADLWCTKQLLASARACNDIITSRLRTCAPITSTTPLHAHHMLLHAPSRCGSDSCGQLDHVNSSRKHAAITHALTHGARVSVPFAFPAPWNLHPTQPPSIHPSFPPQHVFMQEQQTCLHPPEWINTSDASRCLWHIQSNALVCPVLAASLQAPNDSGCQRQVAWHHMSTAVALRLPPSPSQETAATPASGQMPVPTTAHITSCSMSNRPSPTTLSSQSTAHKPSMDVPAGRLHQG